MPSAIISAARRQTVMQRLCRLSTGRTALPGEDLLGGRVTTDWEEMAGALREHWATEFAPQRTVSALRGQWLMQDFPMSAHHSRSPPQRIRGAAPPVAGDRAALGFCAGSRWDTICSVVPLGAQH